MILPSDQRADKFNDTKKKEIFWLIEREDSESSFDERLVKAVLLFQADPIYQLRSKEETKNTESMFRLRRK